MNIEQLDTKLITTPLSKEERVNLIKIFLNKIYLQGIDKGTNLEISRINRIKNIKEKRARRTFNNIIEDLNEMISVSEKRVYREKYRGRYNYYKPKKTTKKEKPISTPKVIVVKRIQIRLW